MNGTKTTINIHLAPLCLWVKTIEASPCYKAAADYLD